MNKELKQKLVEKLRSGEYIQGKRTLRTIDDKYCCLGVLGDILVQKGRCVWRIYYLDSNSYQIFYKNENIHQGKTSQGVAVFNDSLRDEIGLNETEQWKLANMNDDGKSFEEIADYIEKEL